DPFPAKPAVPGAARSLLFHLFPVLSASEGFPRAGCALVEFFQFLPAKTPLPADQTTRQQSPSDVLPDRSGADPQVRGGLLQGQKPVRRQRVIRQVHRPAPRRSRERGGGAGPGLFSHPLGPSRRISPFIPL